MKDKLTRRDFLRVGTTVELMSLPLLGRVQMSCPGCPENPDLMVREAKYEHGKVTELMVDGRYGFIIQPNGPLESQRRWVWECPS
jgi:hypothetical protein